MDPLELWGGIECTINRVEDRFHSQTKLTGHDDRPEDIAAIAALGIRTLRYPVLWEAIAPDGIAHSDWRLPDERLALLKEHGIRPIVGLLHHGSGPMDTSLVDDAFPERFGEYAAAVAERFPWVSHYTPINEPLTTARFSALYGYWYPHARDDRSFVKAVLNQCRGTVLAMQAIRKINPRAVLVQTEDLGRTYSIRKLRYQANFDNHRRWLAWDLLCGRVDDNHPMAKYLIDNGAKRSVLRGMVENPCPPDLIGINHYVTSNRFLHQNERWCDRAAWGSNGRDSYADTEAVRVLAGGGGDVGFLLGEAWRRYRIPLAVTEVHIGCSRDEQLRWLLDSWQAARNARNAGADVRAVTAWALFGCFDWDSLVTEFRGNYEPGSFDVRGSAGPRCTSLGQLVGLLAQGKDTPEEIIDVLPALGAAGWWRRNVRYLPRCSGIHIGPPARPRRRHDTRPLLITGSAGTLGQACARVCEERGLEFVASTRAVLDIGDRAHIAATLDTLRPWGIVNAAGYVSIDAAEDDHSRCYRENRDGPTILAEECDRRGIAFLTFSSDMVFDGRTQDPYVESDPIAPLNVYGQSKAEAEAAVLNCCPAALVIRTSAFFGPWDRYNFVTRALDQLRSGADFFATEDMTVSPTYVPDLVHAFLDLLLDGERGIWHLANCGAVTWAGLARRAAHYAGIHSPRIMAIKSQEVSECARRPRYSVLGTERGVIMPDLESALARYVQRLSAA